MNQNFKSWISKKKVIIGIGTIFGVFTLFSLNIVSSLVSLTSIGEWRPGKEEGQYTFFIPGARPKSVLVRSISFDSSHAGCVFLFEDEQGIRTFLPAQATNISSNIDTWTLTYSCDTDSSQRIRTSSYTGRTLPTVHEASYFSRTILTIENKIYTGLPIFCSLILIVFLLAVRAIFKDLFHLKEMLVFSIIAFVYSIVTMSEFRFIIDQPDVHIVIIRLLRLLYSYGILCVLSPPKETKLTSIGIHCSAATVYLLSALFLDLTIASTVFDLSIVLLTLFSYILVYRFPLAASDRVSKANLFLLTTYATANLVGVILYIFTLESAIITIQMTTLYAIWALALGSSEVLKILSDRRTLRDKITLQTSIGREAFGIIHSLKPTSSALETLIERSRPEDVQLLTLVKNQIVNTSRRILRLKFSLTDANTLRNAQSHLSVASICDGLRYRYINRYLINIQNREIKLETFLSPIELISLMEMTDILVENALEAGAENRAEIVIALETTMTTLTISVSDHGRGIPNTDRLKLFSFGYTSKPNGNGIGLYAIKSSLEPIGGSISYLANEPLGSTFEIKIPITPFIDPHS